jgi:hypothetical protein
MSRVDAVAGLNLSNARNTNRAAYKRTGDDDRKGLSA